MVPPSPDVSCWVDPIYAIFLKKKGTWTRQLSGMIYYQIHVQIYIYIYIFILHLTSPPKYAWFTRRGHGWIYPVVIGHSYGKMNHLWMIYLSCMVVFHSHVKLPKVEPKSRFFQQCIPPAKANLSLTWAGRHCIAEALSIRRSHHPFVLAKTRIWEPISAVVHHKRLKHTKRLFQNTVGHSPFHPTNCIYINCRKCVLGIRQTQTTYISATTDYV